MKTKVCHLSAVGIIFGAEDPGRFFVEMRGETYGLAHARNTGVPIGGNWVKEARADRCSRDTFCREVREEMQLIERSEKDTTELPALGMQAGQSPMRAAVIQVPIMPEDLADMETLRNAICDVTEPYGDFLNDVPKAVLDAADPNNTHPGWMGILCSYFAVPLPPFYWSKLVRLQEKFGVLSTDDPTRIISVDEIVSEGVQMAFAHDLVLQRFFLDHDFRQASQMKIVPGTSSRYLGRTPLPTYDDYLRLYDVKNIPVGVVRP